MCTQNSQDTITAIVEDWTKQERLFTVFELAQEVWNRQKADGQPTERYRHIKGSIHTSLASYLDSPSDAFWMRNGYNCRQLPH